MSHRASGRTALRSAISVGSLLLVAVWSGCGEASGPRRQDTLPVDTHKVDPVLPTVDATLAPGDSVTLAARESLLVAVRLSAHDTVDLGVFNGNSNLKFISLSPDGRFTQPALSLTWAVEYGKSLMFPAIAVADSGRRVLALRGVRDCLGGSDCPVVGTLAVHLRRSAPILVMHSTTLPNSVMLLPFMMPASATGLDTLWIRNAGVGSVPVTFSVTQRLQLTATSVDAAGPARGTGDGAKLTLSRVAPLAPGPYQDTIRVSNVPIDAFHADFPRAIAVTLQVYDDAATRVRVTQTINQLAVSPSGEVLANLGDRYLYGVDPATGVLVKGDSLRGAIGARSMRFTPDGTLYVVAYLNGNWTLFRRRPSGIVDSVLSPIAGEYAVLPDTSIYVLANGVSLRRYAPGSSVSSEVIAFSGAPQPSGLVFSVADSCLYFAALDTVYRRDLRDGSTHALGRFPSQRPLFADSTGRVYMNSWYVSGANGWGLTVLDRNGSVVAQYWPPTWAADGAARRGNTLIGIGSDFHTIWTLPLH